MNPFVQGDYIFACRHIEKAYNAVKEIANDTVNLQKSHPINKVLRHLSKAIESLERMQDSIYFGKPSNRRLTNDFHQRRT